MNSQDPNESDQQPTVIVPGARTRGAVAPEPTAGDAPTTLMPRARVADDASAGASARNASAAPGSIGDAAQTLVLDQANAPTVALGAVPDPVASDATVILPSSPAPAPNAGVPAATPSPADTGLSLPHGLAPKPVAQTGVSMPAPPVMQVAAPRTGASASPSSARTAGSAANRDELPAVGDVVKQRFELIEELGRGGMGAVFRARDLRKVEALDPEPNVAIKFISGNLIGFERAFVALQREAKNAQTLNHPNIVKVFDFDRDGPLVFLTMEVVHGDALHKRLRQLDTHPMGAAEREHIAHGMLAGMSYAHKRDISHADLKPSNMMLDENGDLKILDFGIARRREYDNVFDADDLFALTIDYASPQMLERQRPTPADDVYALGCIVYALHAGNHPFGHVRADQARSERMRAPRPATTTRVQWQALRKALAFSREERFVDAAAFLRAYEGRDWRRIGAIAATSLALVAVIAWAVADPVQSWINVSRMNAEQRQELQRSLQDGTEYLGAGYAEDAVFAFAEALALDASNTSARRGARSAFEAMRTSMPPAQFRDYLSLQARDEKNAPWLKELAADELARLPSP